MKLLQELSWIVRLSEEAITVKPAPDVWTENKDASKTYISNTLYLVKKLDGGTKYEVNVEDGAQRKIFAILSRTDLDKSFTPIRAKQQPDAEGFVQYRDIDEVEAFKSEGDTSKIDLGDGTKSLLSKGDYLLRRADGDNFVYEVKKAKDFEANYTVK